MEIPFQSGRCRRRCKEKETNLLILHSNFLRESPPKFLTSRFYFPQPGSHSVGWLTGPGDCLYFLIRFILGRVVFASLSLHHTFRSLSPLFSSFLYPYKSAVYMNNNVGKGNFQIFRVPSSSGPIQTRLVLLILTHRLPKKVRFRHDPLALCTTGRSAKRIYCW